MMRGGILVSKKHTEHEATITYKPTGRVTSMTPAIGWHVKVDGEKIGVASTLNEATTLLYENGYKVWAFRRSPNKNNRPAWRATVIKKKKKA
jgi:hypothetical protein